MSNVVPAYWDAIKRKIEDRHEAEDRTTSAWVPTLTSVVASKEEIERCQEPPAQDIIRRDAAVERQQQRQWTTPPTHLLVEMARFLAEEHPGTRWYFQTSAFDLSLVIAMEVVDRLNGQVAARSLGRVHLTPRHADLDELVKDINAEVQRLVSTTPTGL